MTNGNRIGKVFAFLSWFFGKRKRVNTRNPTIAEIMIVNWPEGWPHENPARRLHNGN